MPHNIMPSVAGRGAVEVDVGTGKPIGRIEVVAVGISHDGLVAAVIIGRPLETLPVRIVRSTGLRFAESAGSSVVIAAGRVNQLVQKVVQADGLPLPDDAHRPLAPGLAAVIVVHVH